MVKYTLIDTAGIRKRGKVTEKVEKFSIIKTLAAIDDAHVVILLVDAREGIVEQDLHLLGHVLDAGRALVIAVNKWDGTDLEQKEKVKRELDRRLVFVDFAATHFISALHGSGVGKLYESLHKAYESATGKLQTKTLNDILAKALQEHQPPTVNGRRIKLRYAHVGGNNPPIIVIHGNQTDAVPDAYKRYLQHKFVAALKLEGTPVRIEFKTSDNPYKDRKNILSASQVKSKRRLVEHVRKSKKTDKRKGKQSNW
jgi:GTPase